MCHSIQLWMDLKGYSGPEAPVVVKVTRLSGSWRTQESDPPFKNPTDITLAGVQGIAVTAHTHTHTPPPDRDIERIQLHL